ncbi:MAG: hypothetical protein AB7H77_05425 [Bdellovibrionales bacterium]
MTSSTIFVQEADYVGFRKSTLPIQALGVVYDGRDPYATPLGVIFMVLEDNQPREVYVPRGVHQDIDRIAYTHDLNAARYVIDRNGFEEAQLNTGDNFISEPARQIIRHFLESQNTKIMNDKYVIHVSG